MRKTTPGAVLAIWTALAPTAWAAGAPPAHAKNGDTHIVGQGIEQTLDCNNATLFVNGSQNTIYALGTCWAVTVQGSSNTVVADTVVNDITVYGFDQTVFYHNGDPFLWDRGPELSMANRVQRVPA